MTARHATARHPHALWQRVLLLTVGISLFAGFTGLGLWQVQRRAWKLELIARVDQGLSAAPRAIPPASEWPTLQAKDIEYRHVQMQGRWLAEQTVLTQATTVLGSGFWVLTPLLQADNTAVLVNRGFIPAALRSQWQPPAPAASPRGTLTVHGLLRASEPGGGFLRHNAPATGQWYSRDVLAIAAARQLPATAPFFVDAGLPDTTAPVNLEAAPSAAGPWPREGLTVVRFSNSHGAYALTWFGLALMVLFAGGLVARHERRRRCAVNNTAHAPAP